MLRTQCAQTSYRSNPTESERQATLCRMTAICSTENHAIIFVVRYIRIKYHPSAIFLSPQRCSATFSVTACEGGTILLDHHLPPYGAFPTHVMFSTAARTRVSAINSMRFMVTSDVAMVLLAPVTSRSALYSFNCVKTPPKYLKPKYCLWSTK